MDKGIYEDQGLGTQSVYVREAEQLAYIERLTIDARLSVAGVWLAAAISPGPNTYTSHGQERLG